ncbi:MAG: hypothetical protein ABL957_14790 [Parvularculaceae bacterium]
MSAFEHLLTLVSFVLALSMATLLLFVATLWRRRKEARFSLPHALWMLIIFLNQVGFWIGAYNFHDVETATYFSIVFIIVQPVLLFLQSAFVVTGDDGPPDLRAHHADNGRAYLALAAVVPLIEAAFMAHAISLNWDLEVYFIMQGVSVAAILLALLVRNRIVQIAVPALVLVLQFVNIYFAADTLVGAG